VFHPAAKKSIANTVIMSALGASVTCRLKVGTIKMLAKSARTRLSGIFRLQLFSMSKDSVDNDDQSVDYSCSLPPSI